MPEKWYERKSWTESDQADFERHLRRARPDNRASYLDQQARALSRVGDPSSVKAALRLLDRTISEYPDYWALAGLHAGRAACYETLGDIDQAIACYREAFEAQRQRAVLRTTAEFDFSRLVISMDRTELFQEALDVLEEFKSPFVFPAQLYAYHMPRAVIADHLGRSDEARECAAVALSAAEMTRTNLRYHPTEGLVRNADLEVLDRLRRIVAG